MPHAKPICSVLVCVWVGWVYVKCHYSWSSSQFTESVFVAVSESSQCTAVWACKKSTKIRTSTNHVQPLFAHFNHSIFNFLCPMCSVRFRKMNRSAFRTSRYIAASAYFPLACRREKFIRSALFAAKSLVYLEDLFTALWFVCIFLISYPYKYCRLNICRAQKKCWIHAMIYVQVKRVQRTPRETYLHSVARDVHCAAGTVRNTRRRIKLIKLFAGQLLPVNNTILSRQKLIWNWLDNRKI